MNIAIHVKADLSLPESVPGLLQIEARDLPGAQTVEKSELTITPFAAAEPFVDLYGNPCRRLEIPAGNVRVEYRAAVSLPDGRLPMLQPVEADALHLPTDTLLYHAAVALLSVGPAGEHGPGPVRRCAAGLGACADDLRVDQPAHHL